LLVSCVRHSKCFVHVQHGKVRGEHSKLIANVVAYENPTPKIYDILPPPRDDISEVLAVMFSGPCKPTNNDYKHALLFVRCNPVTHAIKWCILNHSDYSDVTFSLENLNSYCSDVPIVPVEYFQKHSNCMAEGISVHNNLEDDSVKGECVFTVHGIVRENLQNMSTEQIHARAIKHLDDEGKFL
ncbi:hypothetical protein GYMLUDRAFT_177518, partial [Collybiopsis luxurians FD-317 M1]